jgi:choline dehydrogenase-like flavoprotein
VTQPPDAIIVGSGPAGVSAARRLLEGGKSVLLVDAGDFRQNSAGPGALGTLRRESDQSWPFFLGSDLNTLDATAESSPKLRTPLAARLREQYLRTLHITTENFVATGALAAGGLSNFWGAVASAYTAADFDRYPIAAESLASHFDAIARRIGISGCGTDDLAAYHGHIALDGDLPVPNPIARLLGRYTQHRDRLHAQGFVLGRARNAVLSVAKGGPRHGCALDNLCLWGCQRGAIYSSAFELDELKQFPRFQLERNFVVQAISAANGTWRITGEQTGNSRAVESNLLLLAAGTLATTRLVLGLIGWHDRPVRLLTNPVFASAFLAPSMVGRDLPERGFAMAQLQYVLEEAAAPSDYASGALYLADGLPASEFIARLPFSRPAARALTRVLMPGMVLATCYFSSDYSDNWMTLRTDGTLAIKGGHSPAATHRVAVMRRRLRIAMRALKLLALPSEATLSTPGSDFHYAGTLPMGGSGPLATTPGGNLIGAPGLYILDAACLPRLTAKWPTFTAMANASRIAEGILGATS